MGISLIIKFGLLSGLPEAIVVKPELRSSGWGHKYNLDHHLEEEEQ